MRKTTIITALLLLLGSLLAAAGALGAQGPCADGEERIGWLGIERLAMRHVSILQEEGLENLEIWIRDEPKVRVVTPGSPADGLLHPGDVITAVGEHLITTREAGRLLALPAAGEPLSLKIRRGGRLTEVVLTPEAVCAEDVKLFWGPPDPPRAPIAPQPPTAPRPPEALPAPEAPTPPTPGTAPGAPRPPRAPSPASLPSPPRPPRTPAPPAPPALPALRGWIGLGFECGDCGWIQGEDGPIYRFASPPTIYSLDPGSPAEQAGLLPGDVLTSVGGVSVTDVRGSRDLFDAEPGDELELGYERDGAARSVTVRIEDRPPTGMNLRYTGELDGIMVEVWGRESVQVSRDSDGVSMTIRTRDALILLRESDG